jgi:gliding motility-associated-like protein
LGTSAPPVVAILYDTFNYTITDTIIDVLANDYDSLHEPLSVASVINFDSTGILGNLVLDSIGEVIFMHAPLSCGTESYQYIVCNYSLCDTGIAIIYVNCPANFFTPQGFSPNGDGINDFLVFPELGYFPNSSLRVFNRYGTVVYQSTDYQNNWDGTDSDTNKPLPDGTYFYVLQVSDGRNFNNYVIINR